MGRGRLTFRQGDLTRALKAVAAAGLEVARVEISEGKVVVVPGNPAEAVDGKAGTADNENEWDSTLVE